MENAMVLTSINKKEPKSVSFVVLLKNISCKMTKINANDLLF